MYNNRRVPRASCRSLYPRLRFADAFPRAPARLQPAAIVSRSLKIHEFPLSRPPASRLSMRAACIQFRISCSEFGTRFQIPRAARTRLQESATQSRAATIPRQSKEEVRGSSGAQNLVFPDEYSNFPLSISLSIFLFHSRRARNNSALKSARKVRGKYFRKNPSFSEVCAHEV